MDSSSGRIPDLQETDPPDPDGERVDPALREADQEAPLETDRSGPDRPRRRAGRTAVAILLSILLLFVLYQLLTWPDVARLATEPPASTAFFEQARKRSESEIPSPQWVSYGRISPHVKRAVLVSEDIDFFSHEGFAWLEMQNAWREFRRGEGLRGASTLTQQLAKNLWLSPSRNPWRKLEEAVLTVQLERRLSKRRILEIYLNVAEMGPGVFGVENASRRFFGKSASELSESEAAALAAALPSPGRWYPGSGSRAAANRQRTILRRMAKAGWLWRVI